MAAEVVVEAGQAAGRAAVLAEVHQVRRALQVPQVAEEVPAPVLDQNRVQVLLVLQKWPGFNVE